MDEQSDIFGELLAILGQGPLLALIEAHGGTRLYIPHSIEPGSKVSLAVGVDPAKAVMDRFAGTYLKVPLAPRWRIIIYRSRGETYAQIARRLVMTESQVGKVLSEVGLTGRQAPRLRRDGGAFLRAPREAGS